MRPTDLRWRETFEDRYGHGSFERLLADLQKPCVTFAEIAERFGVTRENVRLWHQRLLPDAPRGLERRRLCRLYQQKRRLLADGLFARFYRRVRAERPSQRVQLIASTAGFLKRFARVDGRVVMLKRARREPVSSGTETPSYVLTGGASHADFIYYELTANDFLFVPRGSMPPGATTFRDSRGSKYWPFKNSFAACSRRDHEQRAS
jgi:hypothetical protein